jgi:hypothetical protein
MRPDLRILLLISLLVLGSCAPEPPPYSGDGHLADQGFTAPDHRYVADIGAVDLTRTGSAVFHFSGLPKAHYVIGLQVPVPAARGAGADSSVVADVALQLVRIGEGQVLIITGPLRELDWASEPTPASSFVFRRKDYEAYFDAEPKEHYELRVVVNTADAAVPPGTRVMVKSGGWK